MPREVVHQFAMMDKFELRHLNRSDNFSWFSNPSCFLTD
jgi:hypothetical protein